MDKNFDVSENNKSVIDFIAGRSLSEIAVDNSNEIVKSYLTESTIAAKAVEYAKISDVDDSYNCSKKQAFEAGAKWLAGIMLNDIRQ